MEGEAGKKEEQSGTESESKPNRTSKRTTIKTQKITFINHIILSIHPETDAAALLFAKLNVKFMYSIRTVKSGN